jgi:hypothetical protein
MGHGQELMLTGAQLARAAKRWRSEAEALPQGNMERERLLSLAKVAGELPTRWVSQDQLTFEASQVEGARRSH